MPESEAPLPRIPVQPIGYDEAEVLLRFQLSWHTHRSSNDPFVMGNRSLSTENPAPAEWQGNLNVTYHLGPNFASPGWKIRLQVLTSNKMGVIHNTIGILRGSEEDGSHTFRRHLFSL